MREETNSRLGGVVLLGLAALGLWMMERGLQADGRYSVKMAFLVPFVAIMALDFLIHAPKMPMYRMTARDGLYAVLGSAAGVLNLDRYGFFSPDSAVEAALLWGLGGAAVILVIVLLRKVTEQ